MLAELASVAGNVIGGIVSSNAQKDANAKNIALQKEFAKNGIQWKVEDAKKAGIHPLAALGAQTMSFSPISVGADPLGSALASSGQDVSRAINSTRSAGDRADAYTKTVQDLNLRRMGLENDLLASQIAKINQAGIPPAIPKATDRYLLEGQGNTPLVDDNPMKRQMSSPGQPSIEAGAVPDTGFARTPTGWAPVMSADVQQRLEEDFLGGIAWNVRNRLMPMLDKHGGNPPNAIPKNPGEYWIYDPVMQEYRLVKNLGRPRYGIGANYH